MWYVGSERHDSGFLLSKLVSVVLYWATSIVLLLHIISNIIANIAVKRGEHWYKLIRLHFLKIFNAFHSTRYHLNIRVASN